MTLDIPKPVAAYLNADKNDDLDELALCFSEDALVHDENADYRGRDAIREWKRETQGKFQYDVEPLEVTVDGPIVTLRARLEGNFPGSPAELVYGFTLANDLIASLDIQ